MKGAALDLYASKGFEETTAAEIAQWIADGCERRMVDIQRDVFAPLGGLTAS